MGLIRSGNTALAPEDDEELTEYLWPIVREMVKTAIENKQNLIVEGCYITPEWRRDFDAEHLPSIRFICLAMPIGMGASRVPCPDPWPMLHHISIITLLRLKLLVYTVFLDSPMTMRIPIPLTSSVFPCRRS